VPSYLGLIETLDVFKLDFDAIKAHLLLGLIETLDVFKWNKKTSSVVRALV